MRHPPRLLVLGALAVGAVLVLHDPVRRNTLAVLRFPFTVVTTAVDVFRELPRLPSLARDNSALRAELLQRQLEVARLEEVVRRADQATALAATPPSEGVMANVIGRSLIPTQHTILLDRGERQGLVLGAAVVHASGVVGRITELHPASALVTLLTDPESRVAGLVERSRETGLLIGQGHGSCELIYLDSGADIKEGDRIVTAGLGGLFPKGLLLGTVARVVKEEETGTLRASIRPAARLSQVEEALCLRRVGKAVASDE